MTLERQPFLKVFKDVSGGNTKVRRADLLESGPVPVVDQGKKLIAGFTNDLEAICKVELPVIIFGDHTRALKYVDFPFAMGADGTKVLKPQSNYHPPYLFQFLRSTHIPDAGYSRHFKFLKELQIPLPDLAEQERIAAILDKAGELEAKRQQVCDDLDKLQQAVFLDMFGDPVANPAGWDMAPLAELIDPKRPITYGILKPGPDVNDGVPYIRVVDVQDERVLVPQLRRTTSKIANTYKRSQLVPGDLLFSIRGHVGRMALVPEEADGANITQDTARLALIKADPHFVMQCLSTASMQRFIARWIKGAAVKGINLADLKQIPVPLAPSDSQQEFAEICRSVLRLKAALRTHLIHLQSLHSSLQSRAFKGAL